MEEITIVLKTYVSEQKLLKVVPKAINNGTFWVIPNSEIEKLSIAGISHQKNKVGDVSFKVQFP